MFALLVVLFFQQTLVDPSQTPVVNPSQTQPAVVATPLPASDGASIGSSDGASATSSQGSVVSRVGTTAWHMTELGAGNLAGLYMGANDAVVDVGKMGWNAVSGTASAIYHYDQTGQAVANTASAIWNDPGGAATAVASGTATGFSNMWHSITHAVGGMSDPNWEDHPFQAGIAQTHPIGYVGAGALIGPGEAVTAGRAAINMVREGGATAAAADTTLDASASAALRAQDNPCPGGLCTQGACFAAGTLVDTEAGLRPIQEIRAGDRVLSRDEQTGALEYKPVARLFITPDRDLEELTLDGPSGLAERVQVTPNHPFWVEGHGWTAAGDLAPGRGEAIASSMGGQLSVESAQSLASQATVYNLEVEGFHTYFVGRGHAWVHNACLAPTPASLAEAGAQSAKLKSDLISLVQGEDPALKAARKANDLSSLSPEQLTALTKSFTDKAATTLRANGYTVEPVLQDGTWRLTLKDAPGPLGERLRNPNNPPVQYAPAELARDGGGGAAMYDASSNTIFLNHSALGAITVEGRVEVLDHELVHASTRQGLESGTAGVYGQVIFDEPLESKMPRDYEGGYQIDEAKAYSLQAEGELGHYRDAVALAQQVGTKTARLDPVADKFLTDGKSIATATNLTARKFASVTKSTSGDALNAVQKGQMTLEGTMVNDYGTTETNYTVTNLKGQEAARITYYMDTGVPNATNTYTAAVQLHTLDASGNVVQGSDRNIVVHFPGVGASGFAPGAGQSALVDALKQTNVQAAQQLEETSARAEQIDAVRDVALTLKK